jgi:hypothetical protein
MFVKIDNKECYLFISWPTHLRKSTDTHAAPALRYFRFILNVRICVILKDIKTLLRDPEQDFFIDPDRDF